jgi:hypothetical protein
MEKSWKDAIKLVLNSSDTPLHYAEISEQILSQGLYETDGATPAASVSAHITSSIKYEGEKSAFIKVGKGIYTLRSKSSVPITEIKNTQPRVVVDDCDEISIINSIGMYWRRDLVVWKNDAKIFGKQQAQSKQVDFSKQKGIYILYDHHTVVYIGRSIDRPLGKRLYEHTIDRLGSRWDRFSWFGLLDVAEDGTLKEVKLNNSIPGIITALESILIETLEPPQNRKRGDDFTAVEYIQDIDQEIKEKEIQNTLRAIEQKMRTNTGT